MTFRLLFLFGLLTATLTIGCGGILPAPTPTPTATPPPTATAEPTATTVAATPTREGVPPPAIAFALNKTQLARSMNFDFESAVTVVQDGKTTEIPGLALKGLDSTLNRNVTISGTTSDTNEFITYEVIIVGEDVFIRGLAGVPGVDIEQWYQLPEQAQGGVRQLPTARGLIASFSPEDVAKAAFVQAGSETLDGENCTIWEATNPESAQVLIGVTEDSELRDQLGQVDSAEFRIWTCSDGFIHQLIGQVKGHSPQNPDNTTTVNMRFLLSDLDEALDITAPTDVQPFPMSQPNPTPAGEQETPEPVETPLSEEATPTPTQASEEPTQEAPTQDAPPSPTP
jgi:hypothetical protein